MLWRFFIWTTFYRLELQRFLLGLAIPVNLKVVGRSPCSNDVEPSVTIKIGEPQVFGRHAVFVDPHGLPPFGCGPIKFDTHFFVLVRQTPPPHDLIAAEPHKTPGNYGMSAFVASL